jgi:hypothetical protein
MVHVHLYGSNRILADLGRRRDPDACTVRAET